MGISRQAVHKYGRRNAALQCRLQVLVDQAAALRKAHPGCGVEKMYHILKPSFMGRDKFIEVMMQQGFRIKRPPNYRRTTHAGKTVYPNLIKGIRVSSPAVVWQSDITYIPMGDRFYYVVFIVDVYSKKIVGYKLSPNMRATANYEALAMALKVHAAPLIHHSDRGTQYASSRYTDKLKSSGTSISMGLTAQENAYVERLNRTIKDEYLDHWKPETFEQLKRQLKKAVEHYNHQRPHNHLQRLSPVDFENKWYKDPAFKKPTITIFNENNL
jgi:putative transposase